MLYFLITAMGLVFGAVVYGYSAGDSVTVLVGLGFVLVLLFEAVGERERRAAAIAAAMERHPAGKGR